jgi:hypothetical protein
MLHDGMPEHLQRGVTVFVHGTDRGETVCKGDELSVVHKG